MKLKDFKKINESWENWLSEGGEEVKKIFYTRGDYGYIGFSDEAGADLDIGLGQMVLDLVGAGRTDFAPDTQVQRMMKKHEEGAQGGMQRWDSNVFEDYYDADTVKIINGWAAMNGVEAEEAAEKEPEYEDDGTNDFEEYYSEGKKRNKIHELFGFGKKKKEKLNPDGSKEAGTHDALFESGYGVVVGQTVTHQQEPERGKGKVVAVDNKSAQPVALVIWDSGQQQRHDPRVLKPEGGYAVREGGMSDIHIEIQDALSEIMEQYGVKIEDIDGVVQDMISAQADDVWSEGVNPEGAPPKILNTLLVDRLEEVKERIGKVKEFSNDIWRTQVDQARDEVFPEGEQGAPESEFSPASFNKGTEMRERIKKVVLRKLRESKKK